MDFEDYMRELSNFQNILFPLLLVLILLYFLFRNTKKDYHSHWNILLDHAQFSTVEFYERIKVKMDEKNISHWSSSLVHKQVGLTKRRKYLKLVNGVFTMYICSAPYGRGSFVSYWGFANKGLSYKMISLIPFVGWWLARKLFPVTMYTIDTNSMFLTFFHQVIMETIDEFTNELGVARLPDDKRTPILKNPFDRLK